LWKEWTCPIRSCTFVFPTLCLLVFVHFALAAGHPRLAEALFWIAAPLQLLLSVVIASQWVYYLKDFEHVR